MPMHLAAGVVLIYGSVRIIYGSDTCHTYPALRAISTKRERPPDCPGGKSRWRVCLHIAATLALEHCLCAVRRRAFWRIYIAWPRIASMYEKNEYQDVSIRVHSQRVRVTVSAVLNPDVQRVERPTQ